MRSRLFGLEEGSSLNPASRSRRAASCPDKTGDRVWHKAHTANLHYLRRVASSRFEVIRR